jgi:indole-3-glycerol phosphate synthase
MKNYLFEIVERKREEVLLKKTENSIDLLKSKPLFSRTCYSLKNRLIESSCAGVIAEFKRSSPSLGEINKNANLKDTVLGYQEAGAFAVSILTDEVGFGGTLIDLEEARPLLNIPILRKDFIIDEYQIYESKASGADLILLIAACLSKEEVERFSQTAKKLGMEVLLEVHGAHELGHLCQTVDILGVNNRNLETFKVSLNASKEIAQTDLANIPLISESGLKSNIEIKELTTYGFKGFLMGEAFMKTADPKKECEKLINQIKSSNLLVKICGIKEENNLIELVELFRFEEHFPSLLGFISYPQSSRFVSSSDCEALLKLVPPDIGTVLVTVDSAISEIDKYLSKNSFTHIQFHGEESVEYIREFREKYPNIKIIKAILVDNLIDPLHLKLYEKIVDLFLFDSKGSLKGGNGTKFSWSALDDYKLSTPYLLSGGIKFEDLENIKNTQKLHQKMIGLDVNSGFEISPGIKDLVKVKKLLESLSIKGI